ETSAARLDGNGCPRSWPKFNSREPRQQYHLQSSEVQSGWLADPRASAKKCPIEPMQLPPAKSRAAMPATGPIAPTRTKSAGVPDRIRLATLLRLGHLPRLAISGPGNNQQSR